MKINFNDMTIELTATEAKLVSVIGSDEYSKLKDLLAEWPSYKVVVKSISRKSSHKHTGRGLTYAFMEKYIKAHDNHEKHLATFYTKCGLNENGERIDGATYESYGKIKAWFLDIYPDADGKNYRTTKKSA